MPESQDFALTFGNRNTDTYMPTALVVSQAGAWAAAHGEYRIAQQLMGLAAALEASELEHTTDVTGLDAQIAQRIRNVPFHGPTRNEQPAGYPLRAAAPDDASTQVMAAVGSTAPRDCATCGLLIVWQGDPYSGDPTQFGTWIHSSPGTAIEAAGAHEPNPGDN
ncbi:MAG: hypothetical protein QOG34_2535 [Frankiaceae bacterium]|jgi:hypothetical protein|nr:hypothetical protein [Frankiaceae bacterium]